MRVVSEGSAVILHEGNGNVGISRERGGEDAAKLFSEWLHAQEIESVGVLPREK